MVCENEIALGSGLDYIKMHLPGDKLQPGFV